MDLFTFGKNLKKIREQSDLTQKKFADKIGKGFSTVQKYELGLTVPPLAVIEEIANILEVDVSALVMPEDESSQEVSKNFAWLANSKIREYLEKRPTDVTMEDDYISILQTIEKFFSIPNTSQKVAINYDGTLELTSGSMTRAEQLEVSEHPYDFWRGDGDIPHPEYTVYASDIIEQVILDEIIEKLKRYKRKIGR